MAITIPIIAISHFLSVQVLKPHKLIVCNITFLSLFVEKYRPQSVDSYVGNQEFKDIVSLYIAENDIQNLLLYGPAGTGKTETDGSAGCPRL